MSAYFAFVLSVGIAAAVGGALLYDGERSTVSRIAISAILLLAICVPIVDFASELSLSPPTIPPRPEIGEGEYAEVAEKAFCEGIAKLLADKYSVSADSFRVKCDGFDFMSMTAETLTVTLRGAALRCDPLAVEKFINSYEVGVCNAKIGI